MSSDTLLGLLGSNCTVVHKMVLIALLLYAKSQSRRRVLTTCATKNGKKFWLTYMLMHLKIIIENPKKLNRICSGIHLWNSHCYITAIQRKTCTPLEKHPFFPNHAFHYNAYYMHCISLNWILYQIRTNKICPTRPPLISVQRTHYWCSVGEFACLTGQIDALNERPGFSSFGLLSLLR